MRRRVPAGTRLFAQGDPARGFFLVLEGCVKIYKLSAAGAEQALALAGPGETFSRTLRTLKAEGLLGTDGRDLRVLDPAGLRAAAGED